MCWLLFGVHSTPVTAVAHKTPWSFCQKWRWQLTPKHAYAHDPKKSEWADYATVQAYCKNLSGNELTHNLSGNIWPQSSQLTEPLWTNPSINSGISVCMLISMSKNNNKKAAGGEWMVAHSPTILASEEKATTTIRDEPSWIRKLNRQHLHCYSRKQRCKMGSYTWKTTLLHGCSSLFLEQQMGDLKVTKKTLQKGRCCWLVSKHATGRILPVLTIHTHVDNSRGLTWEQFRLLQGAGSGGFTWEQLQPLQR